jgi:hypothetical protein
MRIKAAVAKTESRANVSRDSYVPGLALLCGEH